MAACGAARSRRRRIDDRLGSEMTKTKKTADERRLDAEAIVTWVITSMIPWTASLPFQCGSTPGRWLALQFIVAFWICLGAWANLKNAAREVHQEHRSASHR